VFVLGGPGAGKGTQCANISREFGFVHLSAGDLLRDEQKKGGETGDMIKRLIADGAIVPVQVTLDLIRSAMEENMKKGHFLFLVDGFPRNDDNLSGWNNSMRDFCTVSFCLFLECSEEVMEKRLLHRGLSSGRIDDNASAIKKRFQTFISATQPVVKKFEEEGKVRRIAAEEPVEIVWKKVQAVFKEVDWRA
jgi:UMP-CMP kinase